MSIPLRISDNLLRGQVSISAYVKAKKLYEEENYADSVSVIESVLNDDLDSVEESDVMFSELLALLGWNYVFLKEFDKLETLISRVDHEEIVKHAKLHVVQLWMETQKGKFSDVIESCEVQLSKSQHQLTPDSAEYLFVAGVCYFKTGKVLEAIKCLEIAHSVQVYFKNIFGVAWAANYLGFVQSRVSDYRESLKWFGRTLPVYKDLGLLRKQSMVHLNMGVTYYKTGDLDKSFEHLKKSHIIGVEGEWVHRQCFTNIALGNVYRMTRDFEMARRHLHNGYQQAQELQFPREEALALEFLGDVYRDEGIPMQAERFYARAMAIGKKIAPEGDVVMEVHRRIGECHLAGGRFREARKELERSIQMAQAQGDRFEEAVALRVLSCNDLEVGDIVSARKNLDESVRILEEIGAKFELALSLLECAGLTLVELENGRNQLNRHQLLDRAWDRSTKALDLFLRIDVAHWISRSREMAGRISAMRNAQERADRESPKTYGKPQTYDPGEVIIHTSNTMRDLLQLCDIFAESEEPILVTGETGTGKELVARRIHRLSSRHSGEMVTVNVAAIPATMFEREFFGHVKGAFSGAERDGVGYAAQADGGTLFLDEIGELPLEVQPKLLRLLQDGTYQAIGDPRQRRCDIRLVAATNANLEKQVAEGTFRADLYYRLKILDLAIPPLRDRPEDVLPLLRHFLSMAAGRHVDLAEYFNRPSLVAAEGFEWPGNVREIAMVARRAHIDLQARGRVEVTVPTADDTLVMTGPRLDAMEAAAGEELGPVAKSDAAERSRILMALEESGGSRVEAARALGVGRSTLYRRMVKLGIPTRRI